MPCSSACRRYTCPVLRHAEDIYKHVMFLFSEFKDSVILQQCAVHIVWLASLCHPSSITDSRFIQVVPRVSRISSCLAQMNHEMEFRVQTPSDRPWICQRLAIELIVQHAERPCRAFSFIPMAPVHFWHWTLLELKKTKACISDRSELGERAVPHNFTNPIP